MKLATVVLIFIGSLAISNGAPNKIVCYHESWAVYRPGNGQFGVDRIDPFACSHIIYAFLGINGNTGAVKILDQWGDIDQGGFKKFVGLKTKNPKLKALIALGGASEGSGGFTAILNNPTLKTKFIQSISNFLNTYKFDGIDIDIEYPQDKTKFADFLRDLRAKLTSSKIITAAVASEVLAKSYDVPRMNQYLDFFNVMTYDFHLAEEGYLGHNAPLYVGPADKTDYQKTLNIDYSIKAWNKAGAPLSKIILGIPLYGRSFKLSVSTKVAVGSPAAGQGSAGPYTQEPGYLSYLEVCERVKKGWTRKFDGIQKVPYIYDKQNWVSYDDIQSIDLKTNYAVVKSVGGVLVWSISNDDARNICGLGSFPLMKTIKKKILI